MLEFEEAVRRILAAVPDAQPESVQLAEADDRVLFEAVRSGIDLPRFSNSSMDGYAVRSADLAGASKVSPKRLRILGRAAAGDDFSGQVATGQCVRLFTGSRLPAGADAVVMQEDTRLDPGHSDGVWIESSAEPGENVRAQGEDLRGGSVIANRGQVLKPGRIGLLAATGVAEVAVGRRPKVALLATGSELREPGQPLAPGEIYESNRLVLAELVRRAGGCPNILPLVPDNLESTREALLHAFEACDMVVSSGGVSVGEMDFVKQAFEAGGGRTEFWKVGIKPGRPFVFGRRANQFLFGLPGNPVSAFVTFLLLVRPAVLRWQGAAEVEMPRHPGTLCEPLANPGARRHFVRVSVDAEGNVGSTGIQASHILSSLAGANGLVDVPPETTLAAGTVVQVLRF